MRTQAQGTVVSPPVTQGSLSTGLDLEVGNRGRCIVWASCLSFDRGYSAANHALAFTVAYLRRRAALVRPAGSRAAGSGVGGKAEPHTQQPSAACHQHRCRLQTDTDGLHCACQEHPTRPSRVRKEPYLLNVA